MTHAPSTATAAGPARPYARVSPLRLWALATNTFTQILRMKTLYFLVVFAALLVVFGFIMPPPPTGQGLASFGGEQELRLLKSVSLGAMSWFTAILAIAGTAMLLPRDVEDRTLYTILCKPVQRFEYLLGKLGGVILLLALTLVVMDLVCCAVLYLKQSNLVAQEIAILAKRGQATPDNIAQITQLYARYGLDWNFQAAVLGVFWQATVLAALALLISTFATSSLFTIMAGLALLIIGQGQELARDYIFKDVLETSAHAQRLIAVVVALLIPDLRQFNVIDEVVAGTTIPAWFLWRMSAIAFMYLAFYQLLAWFSFADKEL
ncbi:MAG: ABC transporter permease [Verrucomicrobiales bacterium]